MKKHSFSGVVMGVVVLLGGCLSGCGSYTPLSQQAGTLCIDKIEGNLAGELTDALSRITTITSDCDPKEKLVVTAWDERTLLDYNDLNISNLYRRTYKAGMTLGDKKETVSYVASYKDSGSNYFAQTMTERQNQDNGIEMLARRIYQTAILMKKD